MSKLSADPNFSSHAIGACSCCLLRYSILTEGGLASGITRHEIPGLPVLHQTLAGKMDVLSVLWDARAMHLHLMCMAWPEVDQCSIPDDEDLLQAWSEHLF